MHINIQKENDYFLPSLTKNKTTNPQLKDKRSVIQLMGYELNTIWFVVYCDTKLIYEFSYTA